MSTQTSGNIRAGLKTVRKIQRIWGLLLAVSLILLPTFSEADELPPIWLTSVCYKVTLNAFDKLGGNNPHHIRYEVKADDGSEYSAERESSQSTSETEVVFPDDFVHNKLHIAAFLDCHYGQNYKWSIFVDNKLRDRGYFTMRRPKIH